MLLLTYALAGSDVLFPSTATPPPGPSSGAEMLDVYRSGDLALVVDTDGEWQATLIDMAFGGEDFFAWTVESINDAFYGHFEDDYQYLTVLLVDAPVEVFFAFYSPLSNDIRGLGYDNTVGMDIFDTSRNSLEGFIFLNEYRAWVDDPLSGRYVFDQEFMHRWGSFVEVTHDGLAADALLGRDSAHWSYWLDTPNSPMEGNDWVDQGDGTWSIDFSAPSTYSDLDLYLMGLVGPEEVGDITYLSVSQEEQDRVNREAASTPEYLVEVQGGPSRTNRVTATPITLSIDDIVAAEGERDPGVDESPKVHKMAFLVLVLADNVVDDTVLAEIDGLRQTFEADWEEDVRGLADLDTTLGESDAPGWGETTPTDTATTDSGTPTDTGEEEEEEPETKVESPGGCGCGGGATGGVGALVLAAGLVRRRR